MEILQRKPRTLLTIVLSLIVLYEIMPLFNGYFGAYVELGLVFIGFVLLMPISRKTFYSILSTFAIFAVFIFINTHTRNDGIMYDMYNILKCSFFAMLPVYLTLENEKELLKKLFWVAVIAVTVTQITTIMALAIDPLISRRLIMASFYGKSEHSDLAKQNIGGFAIAYMLPVISVCMYALWKNKKINTALFIGHIILSAVFLIDVQFTIAILIYFVVMAAIFLFKGDMKKIIIFLIIGIIFVILFSSVIADFFGYLSNNTESDVLSGRFGELESFVSGDVSGLNDLELRFEDYSQSISEFFRFPLTGNVWFPGLRNAAGGHSAVFDYLAASGLFGFLVLILAFRSVYKKTICKFKHIKSYELIVLAQVLFFVYACLNPAFKPAQFLILFLLPTAVCFILNEETGVVESKEEQKRMNTDENCMAL